MYPTRCSTFRHKASQEHVPFLNRPGITTRPLPNLSREVPDVPLNSKPFSKESRVTSKVASLVGQEAKVRLEVRGI